MSEPKLVLLKRVVLAFWWRLHGVYLMVIPPLTPSDRRQH